MKRSLFVLFLFLLSTAAQAQKAVQIERDSVFIEAQDTVKIKTYAERYDPRKALLYAAILPGLGQIYNKKYWKLPLVYGGFAAIGYGMNLYQDGFKKYKNQLFYNLGNNLSNEADVNPFSGFTTGQLRTIVDRYRRERDFMVILMAGMYILQIVDAHVDAHLKEFDINPNLRVSVEPSLEQNAFIGRSAGMSIVLRF